MKNMVFLGYRFLDYLYCSLNRNCIYRQIVNSVNIKYQNVSCLLFSRKWWSFPLGNERAVDWTHNRHIPWILVAKGKKQRWDWPRQGTKKITTENFCWSRFWLTKGFTFHAQVNSSFPFHLIFWCEGVLPGVVKIFILSFRDSLVGRKFNIKLHHHLYA